MRAGWYNGISGAKQLRRGRKNARAFALALKNFLFERLHPLPLINGFYFTLFVNACGGESFHLFT